MSALIALIVAATLALFLSHKNPDPSPPPTPEPAPLPSPTPTPKPPTLRCAVSTDPIKLQFHERSGERGEYVQPMPVTKPVAHEAHYVVKGLDPDSPKSGTDRVAAHLDRTCALLHGAWAKWFPGLSNDCREIYKGSGAVEWTPAEGGDIGHGVGALYPSVECEAATGNQYWAPGSRVANGTRYIAWDPANPKLAFVLCMGYEAGPGSRSDGGGVSTEALFVLKKKHHDVLTLGKAIDQTLPYGPIDCGQ